MKKILVVDDNEQNLYMLNALLQGHNFEVQTALNGQDALAQARATPPDLLVTDILMPVMDGYALCREWKKDNVLKQIPFIFYTATYTDPKDEAFGLSLGAERFILKPAEPERFIQILQDVLSGFNRGEMILSEKTIEFEPDYQQKYSERLVQKLEKKMLDIQKVNATLEQEVEKRKKAEKLWEETFNSIDDILMIQDKDMSIVQVNNAALRFFDAQPQDLIGQKCYQVFRGESKPCPGCPELLTLRDHGNHSKIITHACLHKTFQTSSSAIFDAKGLIQYLVYVAKNITEQKKLEEDLLQAQKLEAIGTLAGGIAHDFNNILAAIVGYAELVKFDALEGSPAVADIDKILSASQRATELVTQILTFSRKTEPRQQSLMPHLIVKEALKMLRSSLPATIFLEENIDPECGMIQADPANVHRIVVNLCTNAFQAMADEKGILAVSLYRENIGAEDITERDVVPGDFIVLAVRDTGQGMDAETRERIFEPYFTTKEVGRGTGLGLAVIHGIVKACQGFIRVESEVGKGSTFYIYFPAFAEPVAVPERSGGTTGTPTGTERILVVDDEITIVNLQKTLLEQLGYKVEATVDSLEALTKIQTDPEQFDLIITDQTMPQLSGFELALEVLKIRPQMPVILCTGYSAVASEKEALAIGIKKYLRKPFDRATLSTCVRQVLDGRE